jgi:hypothetical protein
MGAKATTIKLDSNGWSKAKPSDYKGKDLDAALKKYESASGKNVTMPKNMPKGSIAEIQQCIKDLQVAVDGLKPILAALQEVSSAAGKTVSDLDKQAKGKSDDDKSKYQSAQNVANAIASEASKAMADIK